MKVRNNLINGGLVLTIIYAIGAFLVLVSDYSNYSGVNKVHDFSHIAYYEPATNRQQLELNILCPLERSQSGSRVYNNDCYERQGYLAYGWSGDVPDLYIKKPSTMYFAKFVLGVPLLLMSLWWALISIIYFLYSGLKGQISNGGILTQMSQRYTGITSRQRNVLRIVAVLSCIILGPITLVLVTPWLLPLMLYLEYHVKPQ